MRTPLVFGALVSTLFLGNSGCSGGETDGADITGTGAFSGGGTSSASGGAASMTGGSGASTSGSGGSLPIAGTSGSGSALGGGGSASGGTGTSGGTSGAAGAAGTGGSPSPEGFVHPGILVNRGMLDFVKGKVAANENPWKQALTAAQNSNYGKLSYTAKPRETVQCGPTSNPDVGCTDEKNDVLAAYAHALIWYYTGNQANADKAIQIMNAWSKVLKNHTLDNHQLQAAWCSEIFTRAAEIIRYSNAGWSEPDIEQFENMLKVAYLPEVKDGSTRTGNWDTSAIEAAMNIAVFLDDQPQFDRAVALWRARTPAYIYVKADGALPVQPPRENPRSDSALKGYWWDPKAFIDGITQETCRDRPGGGTMGFGHAQYGVAAIINAAETARIQGVDLFTEEKDRLVAFLELHSKYLNGVSASGLCNTAIAGVGSDPMWDIGYNAYANVLGIPLPETKKLVQSLRPTDATHHMAWETLTHGDIGKAGL